jgi:DNA mismatch repair ATPase MutS
MKAFLMYRDRDFDPQQVLAADDRDYGSRQVDREVRLRTLLPWNEAALTQDLGLDVVFDNMARDDRFVREVVRVALLRTIADADTILYRQHVFQDCSEQEPLVRELYGLTLEAIARERKDYLSFMSRYPSGILSRSVDVLQMFVAMLKKLRALAEQHAGKFRSEGFSRLFNMLQVELGDEYFAEIERHLQQLKFRDGVLIGAELGRGNKGVNHVLRKPHEDNRAWIVRLVSRKPEGYTFRLHPRDEGGARALGALRDQGVNLVANALAQSTDHILSFFQMLRTELAFYVGCLNLRRRLIDMGQPICFPIPAPANSRKLSFSELYDVSLALSQEHKVVSNDLDTDSKDVTVITGANTGGKSTFMRSVGLARLMMQAGLFAPAAALSANLCFGICTHYKREEDAGMESGKLDEELSRMSEMIDHVAPNALVLLNESFAATNEREGSEIARQVIKALAEKNVEIIFVTHLYDFASSLFDSDMAHAQFLRAERRGDGSRTFKIIPGRPLQTSYGEDLYGTIFDDAPFQGGKAAE